MSRPLWPHEKKVALVSTAFTTCHTGRDSRPIDRSAWSILSRVCIKAQCCRSSAAFECNIWCAVENNDWTSQADVAGAQIFAKSLSQADVGSKLYLRGSFADLGTEVDFHLDELFTQIRYVHRHQPDELWKTALLDTF